MFFFGAKKNVDAILAVFSTLRNDLQDCADRNQRACDQHHQLALAHKAKQDEHAAEMARAINAADKISEFIL